ncbi:DedA family protein [Sulfurimonas sp.]|uniref:YqaA family protein n=1 Tax=Sulfurimonas sp. TaxID=2022749 RepID=UPI002A3692B6|nr:DedA family protein [Sulfurimonas sp.]MDY0122649.1 DedA family protein [Sulfurimonas sp.]
MAATIFPFSSEVAFVAALSSGMPELNALLFASSGNILAIILNYFLGYLLYEKTKEKLLASKTGAKAYGYGHKYGYYALFLSWLPVIGDPLTLVAGVLRLRFIWFVLIAGSFRIARYYFLTLVV